MKRLTSLRTLALLAGMMLAGNASADAVKPENGNIVISKVFYAASKGAESGNYPYGQYIELYNNSTSEVDITGMYIGLIESEAAANAYSADAVAADADLKAKLNGKVVLKQLFQIPDDKTYTMKSGQTLILCNSAIDHTALAKTGHNLTDADFEVKTTNAKYTHNDNVPALKMVYSFNSTTDFMNLSYSGPAGIVLLKNHEKAVDLENKIFARGKEKGNEYIIANLYYCIDAVDILANTKNGVDATTKRIGGTTYDAGYATTAATGTYNGETVYRKTAFNGRIPFLFDTNDSGTDFLSSATIQPRQFDAQESGMTDTTIVVPESGYLPFVATRTFCGPRSVFFSYVNASAKSTDLKYNEYPGDSLLLMKGDWIAIAEPGTYTLRLSEAQAVLRSRTSSQQWCEDAHKELSANQKDRSIYLFHNEKDKVGFQRVPATSDGGYYVADFPDANNRLHLVLTKTIVANIANTLGVTDLDFIPWHGSTPADVATGITQPLTPHPIPDVPSPTRSLSTLTPHPLYNLNGQRIAKPQKGINVIGGKKVVVR